MVDPPAFAWSVSELEGGLLAGFLEGEIHLGIAEHNGGQSLSCFAQANVRDDDVEILEWIVALTGIGALRRVPARGTSKPQVQWRVASRADCEELAVVLARFPFRGRKRRELEVWKAAVGTWSGRGDARRAAMQAMRAELRALRVYSAHVDRSVPEPRNARALRGYISGFLLAEGSFRLTAREARVAVNLRADDEGLLEMLARESGLGAVCSYALAPPLNPVARWTIASRRDLSLLAAWLLEAGMPGHKGRAVRIWAHGIDHLERPVERRAAARRFECARPYAPPTRRELLAVARPDMRDACVRALVAWAAFENGRLSCSRYSRWRAGRRDQQTRNTIVAHFGSWHGALVAAGLGDRAASSRRTVESRRRAGEERREARRRVQRERVLDGVRRFERERGRLPRALEFLRWRFEQAVDAPTQGTVYRLFPGGWDEVLRGVRQVAGATV